MPAIALFYSINGAAPEGMDCRIFENYVEEKIHNHCEGAFRMGSSKENQGDRIMNQIKSYKIHCISEALSPITHMGGVSGNESILNREKVVFDGNIVEVPFLSGNTIRHRMVREAGALYLIEQCDLFRKLTIDQANYLIDGGALTESSTNSNMKKIAEMQETMPLYRLLGGNLRNQVIGGSLNVLRGAVICRENADYISAILPDNFSLPECVLKSCEDFIGKTQYTRGDATKRKDSDILLSDLEEKKDSNLMIYNGQSLIPGTIFHHGFFLNGVSRLEVGALLHSLNYWSAHGSSIGGSARIGHGILKMSIFFDNTNDFFGSEVNPVECIEEYTAHVDDNKEKIITWLNETFPEKKK